MIREPELRTMVAGGTATDGAGPFIVRGVSDLFDLMGGCCSLRDVEILWRMLDDEGRIRQEGGLFGFFDHTVRPEWSGPILASNRLVLVNSDGEAVAFDPKTGVQSAVVNLGSPAYIAPAAYNGALYVLTDKGELVSIR